MGGPGGGGRGASGGGGRSGGGGVGGGEGVCLRCLVDKLGAADGVRGPLPRGEAAGLGRALRAAAEALETGMAPLSLRCNAHASPADGLSAGLLARCFQFLDGADIARAAQVCKFWNSAQEEPGLWEHKLRACAHGGALDLELLSSDGVGSVAWQRARNLYRRYRRAQWDLRWSSPRFDWAGIHVRDRPDGTFSSPASMFDWSRTFLRASGDLRALKNEFGADEFPEELLLFGGPDPTAHGMDIGMRATPPVSEGVCEWKIRLKDVRALTFSGSRLRPVLGVCLQETVAGGGGTLFVAGGRAAGPDRRTWTAAQALPAGQSFTQWCRPGSEGGGRARQPRAGTSSAGAPEQPVAGAGDKASCGRQSKLSAGDKASCHVMRCVYLPRRADHLSVLDGAALWKVRLDCGSRTVQIFAYPVPQHGNFADPHLSRSKVLAAEFSVDLASYAGLGEEAAKASGRARDLQPPRLYSLFLQIPYLVQAEIVSMEALI